MSTGRVPTEKELVLARDGVFHPAPEDFDFAPLEDLFREELFRVLLKKEKITEERIELLKSWEHSGFRVHADRRVAKGQRQELESLLQYFERPPVSLERLEYRADGRVLYRGTRFHPGLGRDHQLVSGVEFLAMLVAHIALRFECRIYSYGALSTTIRRQFGWVDKKTQSATAPTDVVTVEEDSGRRARGPLRQGEFFQGEGSQLPPVEEEDVSQEVPEADWDSQSRSTRG